MATYTEIQNEMNNCECKSINDIQKGFQSSLISVYLRTDCSIDKDNQKEFLRTSALIRRRIERIAFARVDGICYLLTEHFNIRVEGKEEDKKGLSSFVEEKVAKLREFYKKEGIEGNFDIKLILKPFPILNKSQYTDQQNILSELKEQQNNLIMDIYKDAKDSLMTPQTITDSIGNEVDFIKLLEENPDIYNLTEKVDQEKNPGFYVQSKRSDSEYFSKLKYYESLGIDIAVARELEKPTMLYFYYKIKSKNNKYEAREKVLRPRVLDGLEDLYTKAENFYYITGDQEFKKQFDKLREAWKIKEKFAKEIEEKKNQPKNPRGRRKRQ